MGSENALPSTKHISDQEINERVARKLSFNAYRFKVHYGEPIPDYCHDIKAAWEIVEHLENNLIVDKWERKIEHEQKDWRCFIRIDPYGGIAAYADTAPMAICLAFLKLP